jgi:hypothetical protein
MRNLSNRELVDMACSATIPPKALFEVRQELLRRLEAGDRAIQACREIAKTELEWE